MARRRYVLRFKGQGATPVADVEQVRSMSGVTVLEESSRMLLVEGDDEAVPALESLSGWTVAPERTYTVPDARKRLG